MKLRLRKRKEVSLPCPLINSCEDIITQCNINGRQLDIPLYLFDFLKDDLLFRINDSIHWIILQYIKSLSACSLISVRIDNIGTKVIIEGVFPLDYYRIFFWIFEGNTINR